MLNMSDKPSVVLVHGAWADGSSWSDVIRSLQASGFAVTAPQFPETSLAADVARLRQVLRRQSGPTIVAGHSYGGQIMTALGPDAPNVVALVYIAAFALDKGESLGGLLSGGPPTPALAHLIVDEQAFAWLPEEDFVTHFASDYLVATNDEAIPPDAERMFAKRMGANTIEVPSSHLAMVSHPAEVVRLIEAAANAAAAVK